MGVIEFGIGIQRGGYKAPDILYAKVNNVIKEIGRVWFVSNRTHAKRYRGALNGYGDPDVYVFGATQQDVVDKIFLLYCLKNSIKFSNVIEYFRS